MSGDYLNHCSDRIVAAIASIFNDSKGVDSYEEIYCVSITTFFIIPDDA